jgi:hypothetical protein
MSIRTLANALADGLTGQYGNERASISADQ